MLSLTDLGWNSQRSAALPTDAAVGRVSRVDRGIASVLTPAGTVRARVPNRLLSTQDTDQIPTVGDWVLLRNKEIDAEIDQVLDRTSAVTRKVAGERTRAQVVAANVDVVFVVDDASAAPKARRIERYLALVWESGAVPVVLLNKADAAQDPLSAVEHARTVSLGVDVQAVSARTGKGLELLTEHLAPGRTIVLIGPSGVGKSSLVNAFRGEEAVFTQDVRSDGKGRHTTTYRELHRLPSGALLIDTPGLREVGLWASEDGLDQAYTDIVELEEQCQFRDCAHRTEPGCAVAAAIDAGQLDPARFASWRKLQREVARVRDRRAGWERAQAGAQLRARQRSLKVRRDLDRPRRVR
ncbi:MAG: ribosome small subunit-dependent GTPase A [Actinomycetota bacterium]|nr:ribosome small subunit-dependent GTPase A [Actinomycetota bacterium]